MNRDTTDNFWKTGQVKFFDNEKGFGFVNCWDDEQDYFVHISNIRTRPIDDSDYVIFKLGPSRKKPGTSEVRNLFLASSFTEDWDYLISQYLKHEKAYFRKAILKSLPDEQTLNLLEKELSAFSVIDNDDQYKRFKDAITHILSCRQEKEIQTRLISVIANQSEKNASRHYQVKLWIDGIIPQRPNQELLEHYFIESDEGARIEIFQKVSESHVKLALLNNLLSDEDPEKIFDFILAHIRKVNTLGYYTDIKSKLSDADYWADKKGYDFYQYIINHLEETLSEKDKLNLYLKGYIDSFSADYVISAGPELSKNEIEKIISSGLLPQGKIIELIFKILSNHLDLLEAPNEDQFDSQSHRDWNDYDDDPVKTFYWILDISRERLPENKLGEIETTIISKAPSWMHALLWEKGYIKKIPVENISILFLTLVDFRDRIANWLERERISKRELADILLSNVGNFDVIENRKQFYIFNNHLDLLNEVGLKEQEIGDNVKQENLSFFHLSNWLSGKSSKFDFDELKSKLVFLSPEDQIRFLKKLFFLAHTKQFNLTVEKLTQLTRIDFDIFSINEEFNPGIFLDISLDIVIEAIKSFAENGKFLFDSELLKIVLKDLSQDKTQKFTIGGLFEECPGRFEAEFNWDRDGEIKKIPFGTDQFYFAIEFSPGQHEFVNNWRGGSSRFVPNENFELLKEEVKKLPGRKWNADEKHWGIPSKYEEQVLQFARENRFFLDFEGSNYANNTHLAELKRTGKPNGITYCEGRLAKKKHQMFNREFWWCCNQPCLSNCETLHGSDDWENYTLLDFLTILGFNLDDGNRVGDYIERGKYYQFISTINRFNRLLERMYCDECDHILFPIEDSHFSHYRVVRFHCENSNCNEYHREIYLHHCLNGQCNSIIDSRQSKKCSNGLYICSNEECGCCCSHDMMSRRLQNLETTGGYIHGNLRQAVENKLGHLERGEHFCYNCGGGMKETENEIFFCEKCDITYDLRKNRFKRPHKHLVRRNQE